jgi:ferredoxin-like protein FixX
MKCETCNSELFIQREEDKYTVRKSINCLNCGWTQIITAKKNPETGKTITRFL